MSAYPYKAWMLNKEWEVSNPYETINGNTIISTSWYKDFSGKDDNDWPTVSAIFMDNDNTTTGIPLYYSADETRGQLYLHPYDSSISPCTSSTSYTTTWETKTGSLTAKTPYADSAYFTPESRTYPSAGGGIGVNNYQWFCGWGQQKTGATLEIVSPSIHSFTSSNWPSSFSLNEGDLSFATNTTSYYGYQKISGSIPLYSSGTTLLSSLNDVTITSATVTLQKIVCKFTPSTRNLQFGTTVSWQYDSSWTTSLGTETVTDLSDTYTVYYADKWSGTLGVSVNTKGVQFFTTARTFVETMSSQTNYVGDVYAVFIVPVSATVNYTYKKSVITTSTTSSIINNVSSYIEVGSSLINLKSQITLLKLSSGTDPYQYGYVIRKTADFPDLTLTAQSTRSGVGGIPICVQNNMFYGNGTQASNSATGTKTWGYCSYTTKSSQVLYSTNNGLGQVLCYWQGISNGYAASEAEAYKYASSDRANYKISNSTSYSTYAIDTVPINFNLLYNGNTVFSFQRNMPVLYLWIMYKPNSNKAVALRANTFKLSRSSLSTNDSFPVYVRRYNSTGTLQATSSVYNSSSTTVTMNEGDYLTISGMGTTSLTGPSTSTTQSASVTITSNNSGGSSVNGKDSTYSPGSATLTASVTTAVHVAKVYIESSFNSTYFTNFKITANSTSKTVSSSSTTAYYDPVVSSITTNSKTYSSWSVDYAYRAYIAFKDYSASGYKYTYGTYRYFGGSSSSSSTSCSGYLYDVTSSINWSDSYGEKNYIVINYDSVKIKAPVIKTCTDNGSWTRKITIYNPNPVGLTCFYTSNKTNSKTSANSEWSSVYLTESETTTCTISDQSGFSDEWIIAGFRLASNRYICTTIDEDVTSGTPNVVTDNWYYTK